MNEPDRRYPFWSADAPPRPKPMRTQHFPDTRAGWKQANAVLNEYAGRATCTPLTDGRLRVEVFRVKDKAALSRALPDGHPTLEGVLAAQYLSLADETNAMEPAAAMGRKQDKKLKAARAAPRTKREERNEYICSKAKEVEREKRPVSQNDLGRKLYNALKEDENWPKRIEGENGPEGWILPRPRQLQEILKQK